jgi:hypothetical protein
MTIRQLINRIRLRRYHNFKPWPTRFKSGSWFWNLRKDIRHLLQILAGGENFIVDMLSSILKKNEIQIFENKYKNALQNLNKHYKNAPKNQKHTFIKPLREAKLTKEQADAAGFICSKHLWKYSSIDIERGIVGRKPIDQHLIDSIQEHMEAFSKESSTKTNKRRYDGIK